MSHSDTNKLCPSAPAQEGAILLGVVQADGLIAYLKDRIEVTQEFLEIARAGRLPEQRFRFSSRCQESSCAQWANGRCSLPARLAEFIHESTKDRLPRCSIRSQCKWFEQAAAAACRVCPFVVTRSEVQRMEVDETEEG
jgi:DNA-binding transcriptional regulator YdaS (Cro superfamily)